MHVVNSLQQLLRPGFDVVLRDFDFGRFNDASEVKLKVFKDHEYVLRNVSLICKFQIMNSNNVVRWGCNVVRCFFESTDNKEQCSRNSVMQIYVGRLNCAYPVGILVNVHEKKVLPAERLCTSPLNTKYNNL